jgi:hypothetical protein
MKYVNQAELLKAVALKRLMLKTASKDGKLTAAV